MSQLERNAPRILVVDDEIEMAETVADGLADRGFDAEVAPSGEQALVALQSDTFDALVTDLRMPDIDGLALLQAARRIAPELPVIVMTAYGAIDSAIESIRQGASHYLTKPFKIDELSLFLGKAIDERCVRREVTALRAALGGREEPGGVVGTSGALAAALDILDRVASSDVPVLIRGETGTGKSLFARRLHAKSGRAGGPFVTVNCAALPEALLESELFGHVKGAFTGATRDRAGLFAESSGGTLFLDEIAEMSPALQAKLLDVIERRVARPVGGARERAVDLRVVTATHRDLDERVRSGAFREDLRYRLDVLSLELPALRHRRDDIPLLVDHYLRVARRRHPTSTAERISPLAMARMVAYRWPGNVRELAHAVERMVLLCRTDEIGLDDLPRSIQTARTPEGPEFTEPVLPIRDLTRRYALWALGRFGGHRTRTAERLGIDMKTLAKWLNEAEGKVES